MKAGSRLALYGAGLLVAFAASFALAGVIIPDSFVAAWAAGSESNSHQPAEQEGHGLAFESDGFTLTSIEAPAVVGQAGELSFQILDEAGEPVTDYAQPHDNALHLIAIRDDGTGFAHVYPELDGDTGTWSAPWTWESAGTYRVYAEFTPTHGTEESIALARVIEVAGEPATSDGDS